ncbi:ferritin-like domain-containing protein [Desulfonema magnum]|uniref:Rubrerythrin n=1 Tax=Desulfonema magnum TaxID=45655 RepID=A0A975BVC0_9BACT|nr:ferritin family protein [Desulfonema magnum]QTA91899.1 Rubrerythrin [Desulfonema magnum]
MAAYDFSAEEIFTMAEQIERNGVKFYRTAAEKVDDADSKALLMRLADMEVEHEKTFTSLKADLLDKEKTSAIFDPQGEAELYLQSLADTRVFFKKEDDFSSMKEILKSAVEAEKDSIVFYLGMKEAIPEKLGKNFIDAIIKEEMGHIRLLNGELIALKK